MPVPSCRKRLLTLLSCVLLMGSATATLPPATFQTDPAPYIVGQGPFYVVAANLRPAFPGRRDLIVSNSNFGNGGGGGTGTTISVLLNDGTGVYTQAPGSPITVGISPLGIAVGDFNGDGIPDLAVANAGSNSISILPATVMGLSTLRLPSPRGSVPIQSACSPPI